MKIKITLFVMFATLFSCCIGHSECEESGMVFIFPEKLISIEEDAFEGTAVGVVFLPNGLRYIGKNAFGKNTNLTDVYIPPTTEYIADNALPQNTGLTIHGIKDSYADEWAEEHQIPFVPENIWKSALNNDRTLNRCETGTACRRRKVNLEKRIRIYSRLEEKNESKRPQDRPELSPIDLRFP